MAMAGLATPAHSLSMQNDSGVPHLNYAEEVEGFITTVGHLAMFLNQNVIRDCIVSGGRRMGLHFLLLIV